VKDSSLDYIIVGQGLAGSCMAVQLLRHDRRFVVIDRPEENRCSVVAAGLFNPVTGQNLVKTWLSDILFPYLHEFYRGVERDTGQLFFHPMPLYRPFGSAQEQNEWMSRSSEPAYQQLIDSIYTIPTFDRVHDPLGGLVLRQCGYVNTPVFTGAVRRLLEEKGHYVNDRFDPARLSIVADGVEYEQYRAARIIFCEGVKVLSNPWFNKLPVRALKGETIRIKSDYTKHVILNRGVYMVPGKEEGEWRVGATYNLKDRTNGNTMAGKHELEQRLKELIGFEYEIMDQDWGIRPTVIDRRPILGQHPQHGQLVIFNGLGTKGVSLAPYFSEVLFQWLDTPGPLNKEVDVSRFKSLY
jgi:glycine oxidase